MPYVGKSPADIIATAVDTTTGTFSGDLTVDTSTLVVDSANNRVGIGLSSNIDRKLHVEVNNTYAAKFGGTAGGDFAIEIGQTGTNGSAGLNATGTGGAMKFSISGTERMRIDSSGNLLVGTTAESTWASTAGHVIRPNSSITSTRDGGQPLIVNRLTSDGTIIDVRKDGSTVGSIGAEGGQIYIVNGDTGLKFASGVDGIIPVNAGGANRDNAIDLGVGSVRFKDLYLSNAAYTTYVKGGSGHTGQMHFTGSHDIRFVNNGNERMRIDSSGNVGINTSSQVANLEIKKTVSTTGSMTDTALHLTTDGTTGRKLNIGFGLGGGVANTNAAVIGFDVTSGSGATQGDLFFSTRSGTSDSVPTERMRITSGGNVGIGTSSPTSSSGGKLLAIETTADVHTNLVFNTANTDKNGIIEARRTGRSGAERFAQLNLQNNSDGGEMRFYTASSGSDISERMRIESGGNIVLGKTTVNTSVAGVYFSTTGSGFTRESGSVAFFNRQNNDGQVIGIGQQDITEGTISVSGSTVSYNGGHLSRWSRLLDNSKDTTIVKGTVMTNLDEMVEWGDEDNEQLNKMAVSSVEGDANVAGVFVNWDNDDDWNDMNIAMTGDMVIRIAQGTTVARGDLLMSAGDGTAKPQDDDIVRSKTIAKVTSTNVSHTYDDGTYLVPCVLMAC